MFEIFKKKIEKSNSWKEKAKQRRIENKKLKKGIDKWKSSAKEKDKKIEELKKKITRMINQGDISSEQK